MLMLEPRPCKIMEQVIEDAVTGLTFQFEVTPNGECRMHVFGDDLEHGNRTFEFGKDGLLEGRGTSATGTNRPTWRVELEAL